MGIVDAHTANHLYHECLKGDLMRERTVILVSHHVQLCVPGASYVVALDNGRVLFSGDRDAFLDSGVMSGLAQSQSTDKDNEKDDTVVIEDVAVKMETSRSDVSGSEASSTVASETTQRKKSPRKLIEEETRAVGRIRRDIWETYIWACGDGRYWVPFIALLVLAALCPVAENGWLKYVASSRGALYIHVLCKKLVRIYARRTRCKESYLVYQHICSCKYSLKQTGALDLRLILQINVVGKDKNLRH
jgi:hypothetical protein